MSAAYPLTASSDIQIASVASASPQTQVTPSNNKSQFGEFSPDIVEISALGREKQQQETASQASQQVKELAQEVVRVTSTIGKSRSSGNLTQEQATDLYNEIAALL